MMEGITEKGGKIPGWYKNVSAVERLVYHPADIDIESLEKMVLHGPEFAIASYKTSILLGYLFDVQKKKKKILKKKIDNLAFGFENEMIYMNKRLDNGIYHAEQDWFPDSKLTFLYFNDSYWMVCNNVYTYI
ncbi:hypothetical protein RFI_30906 [Reticulomyxa filosa]|uniref:Uncharacterized protein n=1 Tax=Reticulomyxa filosa TaxID=46433 RepID=X6LZB8_RETFI|nr:hypothetical protein RFI_30906 [Reticulomyxa filosa]|eukprot:ETO06487.1 hypothetical protein RFI_30906 [Reticulomyxa filosa]